MDAFTRLEATIRSRQGADPASSYVASLFARGRGTQAQKLGEEAVELVIAATSDPARIVPEAADLVFHLAVLLADAGLSLADVAAELERREGVSGHREKAERATSVPTPAPLPASMPAPTSATLSLSGMAADPTAASGDALPLPRGGPLASDG